MFAAKPGSSATAVFEDLVVEHHRQALAYAQSLVRNSALAEDLVQDAFLTAHVKFERFDRSMDFGKWIRGIIRNKYRNWAKTKRVQPLEPEFVEAISVELDTLNRKGTSSDALSLLRRCIKRLSEVLRRTVGLFYFEDMSCAEVAEASGVRGATVRKRLQLARNSLADCISGSRDPE